MMRSKGSTKAFLPPIQRWLRIGCADNSIDSRNRNILFTNLLAMSGVIGCLATLLELLQLNFYSLYLLTYVFMILMGLGILALNYFSQQLLARRLMAFFLNLAAWNAALIFGKSFNGYQWFFVAMVFTLISFKDDSKESNVIFFALSLFGLLAVDLLSYNQIIPVTTYASSQFPVHVLWLDTVLIACSLGLLLYGEMDLFSKNEKKLSRLNRELEGIVQIRTQAALDAREEAIQASLVKSQFVANTSHELRTPLGAIKGFIDLILEEDLSAEDQLTYLNIVRRNADQLSQIIDDVLDLSKAEAQKIKIERKSCNLSEILNDVSLLMRHRAEEKGLELHVKRFEGGSDYFIGDSLRIRQILINLLGNAIKFTEKGRINLSVQFLESLGTKVLVCDVSDSGPGLKEQHKSHLFEPFWQANRDNASGGTGLGLSLSKRLAQLLDGDLILHTSTVGLGSTFRFTMNYVESDQNLISPLPAKTKVLEGQWQGKTFLVVDDSRDNQQLLERLLIKSGARIDHASNGQEALESIALQKKSFDLIFMDIQMPIMDGYEATRILKQRQIPSPIVALTAHAMTEDKEKAKRIGFDSYLTKPINKIELMSTIEQMIAH